MQQERQGLYQRAWREAERRWHSVHHSQNAKAVRMTCPSVAKKRVTPHVFRHTAAMELLQAGVDQTVIALWLGHESLETTLKSTWMQTSP